jgi:hypothetical protein
MSIPDRLRCEAHDIPGTAPPDLAARMQALVAAQGALPRAPRPLLWSRPVVWAAAAGLLLAAALLWGALSDRAAPAAAALPAPAALPSPPTLDELLATTGAPDADQAVAGELAALSADLAAVLGTVRGSIPF